MPAGQPLCDTGCGCGSGRRTADSDAARAVLDELRAGAKFVFGKNIEAACHRVAFDDAARRCVGRARSLTEVMRCTGGAALVAAARDEIKRRNEGAPEQIPASPGGTDCAAFADHVLSLAESNPSTREDVRMAMAYACSVGDWKEPILACIPAATTLGAADVCDPTRTGLQHPSLTTPSIVPARESPPPPDEVAQ